MKINCMTFSILALALKLSSSDPTFPKTVDDACDYVDEYIAGLIQRQGKLPVPEESVYRSKGGSTFQPIIKPKKQKLQLKPGTTEEEEEAERMMFENEERKKEEDYLRAVADQRHSLFIQQQQTATYGLKQSIMSIVEHAQLKPNENPLPNSLLYSDLFKRTKREDEQEQEDVEQYDESGGYDNDDEESSEENEAVTVYEERQKKINKKKKNKRSRSKSSKRNASEPPKKKTKTKDKKKNKKMAENGVKNIINPFSLSEAEVEEEEKSWSDQGEEEIMKEEIKKQKKEDNDDPHMRDCLGCIMLEAKWNEGEQINKCPINAVCKKRCQEEWSIDYDDVLEWMETCIGCAMSGKVIWWKTPPNTVCNICKDGGITYEKAKKWKDGNEHGLYAYDIEPQNQTIDLVLTKKGDELVDSFDSITFKSEPDENDGQLEFDDKSDAIDFLNNYRRYEEAYDKLQSMQEVNEELNGNIASLFTKLKEKDRMIKTIDERNESLIKNQSTFLFIIDSLKKKYQELKEEYELLEQTNLQSEDQLLALRRYLDIDYNLDNFDYDDCLQTLPMDYCDNDPEPNAEDELMTEIHNNQREKMEINDESPKQKMDAEEIMEELTPEEYIQWKKDNYKDQQHWIR